MSLKFSFGCLNSFRALRIAEVNSWLEFTTTRFSFCVTKGQACHIVAKFSDGGIEYWKTVLKAQLRKPGSQTPLTLRGFIWFPRLPRATNSQILRRIKSGFVACLTVSATERASIAASGYQRPASLFKTYGSG
jgi:hypothetical protein